MTGYSDAYRGQGTQAVKYEPFGFQYFGDQDAVIEVKKEIPTEIHEQELRSKTQESAKAGDHFPYSQTQSPAIMRRACHRPRCRY